MPNPDEINWNAVAARAQAYQALHIADLGSASLLQRANFLMALGLPRGEAAALLGSTDASLKVTINKAKRKTAQTGTKQLPGDDDA